MYAFLLAVVQRRNLFDDRAVEISQLTQVIKADLAAINSQIAGLQQFASKAGKPKGPKATVAEHQGNVVSLLQSSLAGATSNFQDILETRTQNIKASRDRTGQYAYGGARPATGLAETSGALYDSLMCCFETNLFVRLSPLSQPTTCYRCCCCTQTTTRIRPGSVEWASQPGLNSE